MTETWDDHERLPFTAGRSPFHIKGLTYRAHIEYANKHIPGGADAVNATFKNPALKAFLSLPFLAASWVDAFPMVSLWYASARLLNQPPIEFLKARTRHQAEQDIHGVYRLLLKLASAEAVALRMPRVVGQYFDFGSTEVNVVRPGVVHMEQSGLPLFLAPWFAIVGETYLHVALEIAGARQIKVLRKPLERGGEAHGVPLAKLVADVHFDTGAASAK